MQNLLSQALSFLQLLCHFQWWLLIIWSGGAVSNPHLCNLKSTYPIPEWLRRRSAIAILVTGILIIT